MKVVFVYLLLFLTMGFSVARGQGRPEVWGEGTKKTARITSAVSIIWKSHTFLSQGRWSFCGDLAFNKNSLPNLFSAGNVSKEYHGCIPLYASFALHTHVSMECGAFTGVAASRSVPMGRGNPVVFSDLPTRIGFDTGLLAGVGLYIRKLGKIRIRYNYGLPERTASEGPAAKTRRLDTGLTLNF